MTRKRVYVSSESDAQKIRSVVGSLTRGAGFDSVPGAVGASGKPVKRPRNPRIHREYYIPVKITRTDGPGRYRWVEQEWDADVQEWVDKPGGRTHEDLGLAREANEIPGVISGFFTYLRPSRNIKTNSDPQKIVFEFDAYITVPAFRTIGATAYYPTPGDYNLDVPENTKLIIATGCGGGGGGAAGQSGSAGITVDGITTNNIGLGGGAGGTSQVAQAYIYILESHVVDFPSDIDIHVGAGGDGGAGDGAVGSNGDASTILVNYGSREMQAVNFGYGLGGGTGVVAKRYLGGGFRPAGIATGSIPAVGIPVTSPIYSATAGYSIELKSLLDGVVGGSGSRRVRNSFDSQTTSYGGENSMITQSRGAFSFLPNAYGVGGKGGNGQNGTSGSFENGSNGNDGFVTIRFYSFT